MAERVHVAPADLHRHFKNGVRTTYYAHCTFFYS
jgi:hypothetical protein